MGGGLPVHLLRVWHPLLRWHTKALSSFAMALVLTFIYSFLTVGYSKMVSLAKDTLFLRGSNPVKLRAFVALTFAVGLVVKYSIMFLIMTMNGWVNLVLALGMMSGYVAFMLKRDCKRGVSKKQ